MGNSNANPIAGGVFGSSTDDFSELRELVDDIGGRAFEAAIGRRSLPDTFDSTAWSRLETTGLTRLTSAADSGGGPNETAVVLRALARHAVTVPLAETDLLACWLAGVADLPVPEGGPLTVAVGSPGRPFEAVPYAANAAAIVLAVNDGDRLRVTVGAPDTMAIAPGHNAGGEPRDTVVADLSGTVAVDADTAAELTRRGAWARCIQVIGALDAAVEYSVAHAREREQFGRSIGDFQSVQHALARMAGEVEQARAAVHLAVAAATEHGFISRQTDYAVTVAKVALGRIAPAVVATAHQLHGAIGTTMDHRLWLATQRARSWISEFGDTASHAGKLGRMALAGDLWQMIVSGGAS